jgi:hypothetical protein
MEFWAFKKLILSSHPISKIKMLENDKNMGEQAQ